MPSKLMRTLWGVPYTKSIVKDLNPVYSGFEVAIAFADFDRSYFLNSIKEHDKSLIA